MSPLWRKKLFPERVLVSELSCGIFYIFVSFKHYLTIFFHVLFTTDSLLMHYTTLDSTGYNDLQSRLATYMSTIPPLSTSDAPSASTNTSETGDSYKFRWRVTSTACPVYLLGRYRKLARDVPQSPWTVSVNGKGGEDDEGNDEENATAPAEKSARLEGNEQDKVEVDTSEDANASAKGPTGSTITYARKGRCSVEEIINSVVKEHLQAAECRMHPCGREDIDVRCLGKAFFLFFYFAFCNVEDSVYVSFVSWQHALHCCGPTFLICHFFFVFSRQRTSLRNGSPKPTHCVTKQLVTTRNPKHHQPRRRTQRCKRCRGGAANTGTHFSISFSVFFFFVYFTFCPMGSPCHVFCISHVF